MYRLLALAITLLAMPPECSQAPQAQSGSRYIRQLDPSSPVIIFVHGALGDSISTWTTGKSYWPQLLTDDEAFAGASVYVLEYPTNLFSNGLNINQLSIDMRRTFEDSKIDNHKELIFVAHSMGGLVVRDYLMTHQEAATKTRFIFFFSTPTIGSELANWADLVSPSTEIKSPAGRRSMTNGTTGVK